MKNRTRVDGTSRFASGALGVWMLLVAASASHAQSLSATDAKKPSAEPPPVKVHLHPQAEPCPALKYQLLPPFAERFDGNAAVEYGKVLAEQNDFLRRYIARDKYIHQMPLEDVRNATLELPGYFFLERGARCKHCEWQLALQDKPFTLLLPELQQTRMFARVIADKVRWHIARGEFDKAVKTMQNGYALARHVSTGETLINTLVGIAIQSIMHEQLQTMIEQPGAPNLYWALTALPDPLVDVHAAVEAEANGVEAQFAGLRDVETLQLSDDAWRERLQQVWLEMLEIEGSSLSGAPNKLAVPAKLALLTALSVPAYPIAKRGLVERGFAADAVEKMPVAQVILIHSVRVFRELRDDDVKGFFLPYPQAQAAMRRAETQLIQARTEGREGLPLASLFLSAYSAAKTAEVRARRSTAVLRVFEALRLYAAAHEGQLPEWLSDLTDAPAPDDPVTCAPFEYTQIDAHHARFGGPAHPNAPCNYEISMTNE